MPLAAYGYRLILQVSYVLPARVFKRIPGHFYAQIQKRSKHMLMKYLKTAQMTCLEKTNGGILYLLPDIIVKIGTLIPLIYACQRFAAAVVYGGGRAGCGN
jgi:hypothetical protein